MQSMGSQTVGYDLVTQQQYLEQNELNYFSKQNISNQQLFSIRFRCSVMSSVSDKLVAEKIDHWILEMMNIYFVNHREEDKSVWKRCAV